MTSPSPPDIMTLNLCTEISTISSGGSLSLSNFHSRANKPKFQVFVNTTLVHFLPIQSIFHLFVALFVCQFFIHPLSSPMNSFCLSIFHSSTFFSYELSFVCFSFVYPSLIRPSFHLSTPHSLVVSLLPPSLRRFVQQVTQGSR